MKSSSMTSKRSRLFGEEVGPACRSLSKGSGDTVLLPSRRWLKTGKRSILLIVIFFPLGVNAQSFFGEIESLHSVLDRLYYEMIPLSARLISVGRGLAGFAALWYIGSRIWRHIANAEPVDFYPLLRPFALGFC